MLWSYRLNIELVQTISRSPPDAPTPPFLFFKIYIYIAYS